MLTKELAEQSARRRTYIVRALYALLLYGFALGLFYQRQGSWSTGNFSMLGQGQQLFTAVLEFQFVAVYALLPMLMAGVLTSEKERDTLGLLLITRLGPWTIVFEKFLSRTIPMLFYLLLSLPLLGVAYSLGGVETGAVLRAGLALTVCVLQVGALAVFCSAWCRTTSQALVTTYMLLVVVCVASRLYVGSPMWQIVGQQTRRMPVTVARNAGGFMMYQTRQVEQTFPLNETVFTTCNPWMLAQPQSPTFALDVLVALLPMGLFLLLARLSLWPRAFVRPRSWGLKFLHAIDGVMDRLNQNSFTKGVVLIREHTTLPWDKPIAWRETARRSFGTTRYLVRLLLAIEVPLLFWLLVPMSFASWHVARRPPGAIEQWVVWWLGTLVLITLSTGLVAGERSRQTLDVLLSTPLTPREIVRQKFAGLWRVMFVLGVPYLTTVLVQVWWADSVNSSWDRQSREQFLALALLAGLVYWPLIALIGFECGLRCRTQLQAMTVTLGIVLAVFAAPFLVMRTVPLTIFVQWYWWIEPLLPFATVFSDRWEAPFRGYRNFVPNSPDEQWSVIRSHVICYIAVFVYLWWQIPREFTRVMRRCEPPELLTLRWPALQSPERGASAP